MPTPSPDAKVNPADFPPVPDASRTFGMASLIGQKVFGDRLQMLTRFADTARETGGVARFRFVSRTIILVNNPNAIGDVLLGREADFHKGPALSIYARPLLGNGLLTSEGDFHRAQRKLASPAFAHGRIKEYAEGVAQAGERAQAAWQAGQRNVADDMMKLTLGIVGETLFGVAGIEKDADDLGHALTVAMRHMTSVIRTPVRLPFAFVPPWKPDVKAALARLDETIYGLVREKRAAPLSTSQNATDLLARLVSAKSDTGEAMSDKQLRDEAMTLFLAGHETTANALAWAWYLLAQNPAIYDRMESEITSHLKGQTPTYEDLAHLPYTLQVFKEVLRLYPPAYALVRQAMRPTVVGGFRVPARAIVVVSPYVLHRRPDAFPDPEIFNPDHFTPDCETARHRYDYLPFGGGPRVCIGAAFALMEGHLLLATLAQRVRFRLPSPDAPPVLPDPMITLRPSDKTGVPLLVERR